MAMAMVDQVVVTGVFAGTESPCEFHPLGGDNQYDSCPCTPAFTLQFELSHIYPPPRQRLLFSSSTVPVA